MDGEIDIASETVYKDSFEYVPLKDVVCQDIIGNEKAASDDMFIKAALYCYR